MFSDALDREAAWLNTSGDGLPALAKAAGGPFQIIQPRWPRQPAKQKSGIYVLRAPSMSAQQSRFGDVRSHLTTRIQLRLTWPLNQGASGVQPGQAEAGYLLFEQAIDQVILRVSGFLQDKTHGGRFLAVAEDHPGIAVSLGDPEQELTGGIARASIEYLADDPEINN